MREHARLPAAAPCPALILYFCLLTPFACHLNWSPGLVENTTKWFQPLTRLSAPACPATGCHIHLKAASVRKHQKKWDGATGALSKGDGTDEQQHLASSRKHFWPTRCHYSTDLSRLTLPVNTLPGLLSNELEEGGVGDEPRPWVWIGVLRLLHPPCKWVILMDDRLH